MEKQKQGTGWLRWVGHLLWKALPRVSFSTPSQRVTRKTDLPKPACLRIDKVTSKTMLWTKEQTEVAKRLVIEFEKGLSQGNALEDLLDRYDRPRRAAKAIRREMIAKRSRGWHIRRRIRKSLCYLAIASYVGLGVYYALGTPVQRVDYLAKLNERAAAVPEEDRAWPAYREALLELGWMGHQWDYNEVDLLYDYLYFDSNDSDSVRILLDTHKELIARLRETAEMSGLGFVLKHQYDGADRELFMPEGSPVYGQRWAEFNGRLLLHMSLPHLSYLLKLGELLCCDALMCAELGDAETCVADLMAIMHMARFADEHPSGWSQLRRISFYAIANETLCKIIIAYPGLISDVQLVALGNEVALNIPVNIDLSGDRMVFEDYLQRIYTDNGRGGGHLDVRQYPAGYGLIGMGREKEEVGWWGSLVWYSVSPITISLLAPRQDLQDMYTRIEDRIDEASGTAMRDQPELEVDWNLPGADDSKIHRIRYMAINNLSLRVNFPYQNNEPYQGRAEGVVIGVALERFRLREGTYPETLDALVPDYVEELPVDRMNGEALLYRKSDAGPVIYSVGSDGDDDGGFLPASYGWEFVEDAAHLEPGERVLPQERIEIWEGQPELAARWNDDDPADGDWILWPLHDPPLMPEPVDGKRLVR